MRPGMYLISPRDYAIIKTLSRDQQLKFVIMRCQAIQKSCEKALERINKEK